MLFGTYIVLIGFILYVVASVGYAWEGQWAWCMIYGAYAVANLGLAMAAEGWQ